MAIQAKIPKWTVWFVLLVSISALALLGYYYDNRTAQSISPGTFLEQAQQLSKGKKGVCLTPTQQAASAVSADDGYLEWNGEKISKFETAAGFAIADIPAGTDYAVGVNSYENGVARGSMAYENDYGTYNYEIKKLPAKGEWTLISTVACEG